MKKIKEKMTVVSADGKVTFYLEKRSDVCLYDCLHLDVIDDVEELRLDIPGMTTLLLSEEHAFPSVRKIYIGKEIQNIMIYNKTFPNVREVESDSNVFCSGSMLVRNENFGMSKTLLNTFCLKSDETADLNGIADIVGSAFYGCECTKAINTEQVKHMSAYAFRDSAFADAKKNPPVDGLLMAGSIIIAADPQADKYVIPDFATLCNSLKFNLSATLVVENVTVSAHILYLSGKIEEVHGLPETVVINDSVHIDESAISNIVNRPGNLRHIIFGEKNTEYVAIDDIVYTKDMKKLLCCVKSKTGNVEIPSGVEYIANDAFYHCKEIDSVKMPDSITEIGNFVFGDCKNLKQIIFSKNLKKMGTGCFIACEGLEAVDIPGSLNAIPRDAFRNNKNLKDVILHEGLQSIKQRAFFEIGSLPKIKSLRLPKTVKHLDANSLKEIPYIEILSNKFPEGMVGAIVTTSPVYNDIGILQVKTPDSLYFLPPAMTKANISRLEDDICLSGPDALLSSYKYALTWDVKIDIAFAIYEEHKTAETARYLAKNAKKIAKKAMETNDLEMLTKLLEYDVFSKKSIRFIYDLISDDDNEKMVTTKAYALEKMQRRANKNNFSL